MLLKYAWILISYIILKPGLKKFFKFYPLNKIPVLIIFVARPEESELTNPDKVVHPEAPWWWGASLTYPAPAGCFVFPGQSKVWTAWTLPPHALSDQKMMLWTTPAGRTWQIIRWEMFQFGWSRSWWCEAGTCRAARMTWGLWGKGRLKRNNK